MQDQDNLPGDPVHEEKFKYLILTFRPSALAHNYNPSLLAICDSLSGAHALVKGLHAHVGCSIFRIEEILHKPGRLPAMAGNIGDLHNVTASPEELADAIQAHKEGRE